MPELTTEHLQHLLKLDAERTPGEWYANPLYPVHDTWPARYVESPSGCICTTRKKSNDVEAIAAAVNALRPLVLEVLRLREENEQRETYLANVMAMANEWRRNVGIFTDIIKQRDLAEAERDQLQSAVRDMTKSLHMYRAAADQAGCPKDESQYAWIEAVVAERDDLRRRLAEAEKDRDELQAGFDLRWKADIRAISRWKGSTGQTMNWPDHADLCCWLMDGLAASEASRAKLREALRPFAEINCPQWQHDQDCRRAAAVLKEEPQP